jgi:prevent-host-death family protein
MKIAPVAEVKARLSAYIQECEAKGPIVVTRNGKAVVVMIAPDDDQDLERLLLGRSPALQALLRRSRKSLRSGQGMSSRPFWKAVAEPGGKATARTRAKVK